MLIRPSVLVDFQIRTLNLLLVALAAVILMGSPSPACAQEGEGTWRLLVRENMTRGAADRLARQFDGLPEMEVVAQPNGTFSLYVGRYTSEAEAEGELNRYFEQDGIRLGTAVFIPSGGVRPIAATPSPTPTPTPTPVVAPVATPEPVEEVPRSLVGTTVTPAPSPSPTTEGMPWGLIAAMVTIVIIIGTGVYLLFLRKAGAAPPPPVAVKPTIAPVSPRSRGLTNAKAEPEKPAPAPQKASPAKAAPVAGATIRFEKEQGREPEPEKSPEVERGPIAMPEVAEEPPPPPKVDPAPAIILNDIFTDEPEESASATPVADEGPKLDFLVDDDSKGAGPQDAISGDEGLGLSVPFTPAPGSSSPSPSPAPVPKASPVAASAGGGSVLFELDLASATLGQAPPNWTGSYDYAKLTVASGENGSGTPHLRFEKENGIGSAYYSCHFPDAHGRLAVDFEIRCDDKNKYLLGFYIEKDQDFRQSIHALIHRTNAKASPVLRLQNESVPYEFGTWRKVRYEIDLVRHIIDGFVDNEPVIVGQRLTSCPDGLNTLSIRDNLATTGVLLLRGIKITALD